MMQDIIIEPLSAEAFAPYGEVIEPSGTPTMMINRGKCGRYHDIASLDFGDGKAGISVFEGELYALPLIVDLMERHPLGSQAFLPMSSDPFLVLVAQDIGGMPSGPRAFITAPGQGVNYYKNTWHGVLTPLVRKALFAVVDRIGEGNNLEEHTFKNAFRIMHAES